MKQITQEQVKESKRGMIVVAIMLVSILTVGTIFVFAEDNIEVIDIRDEDCSNTMEVEFCEASLKCRYQEDTLNCICEIYPEWRGCSVLTTTTTSTTSTTIKEGSHDNMRWENKKVKKIIPKPNCDIEIARVTWIVPNTFAHFLARLDRDQCVKFIC